MGGMVVPFVVFVVLVVVEVLPSEKNHCGMIQEPKQKDGKYSEELQERRTYITKERFHSMFKVLVPLFTALFVLGYTLYAINIINSV